MWVLSSCSYRDGSTYACSTRKAASAGSNRLTRVDIAVTSRTIPISKTCSSLKSHSTCSLVLSHPCTNCLQLGGGSTASVSLDLKRSRLAPPSPGESNHNSPDHTTTTAQQALHHQAPRSGATVLTTLRPTAAVEAAAGSARLVALAAGGDPCPTCSNNASAGNHFGWTCRCGWANAGDKARGGFTGGEPVAAAGARFGAAATAATDDGVGGGTTESVVQPVAVGDGRGAAGRVSVRGNGSAGVVEVTVTPGLGGRVGLSGVNGVALSDGHQQQPEQQQFQFPSGESEDKVMVDVEAEGADVIMRDAGNRLGGREERILLNDAVAPSSPSVQQSVTSPVVTPKTATLTAEAAAAAAAAAGAAGLLPHQTKTFAGGGAAAAATRETVGGAQVMVKSESNVKGGGPTASLTPPTATAVMMMAPSPSPWAHQQHQQQQLQYQQQQIQLQQLQQQAFQQQQLQMQQQRQLMQLQQEAEAAAAAAGGQVASGGLESLPVMMMPSCPKNSTTAVTMISQGGISGGDARLLTEPDTMDRLAQSLAQVRRVHPLDSTVGVCTWPKAVVKVLLRPLRSVSRPRTVDNIWLGSQYSVGLTSVNSQIWEIT